MFNKHLLYLTSDQLCAYEWQGGRLTGGTLFANDAAGVDAFMDYIDQHHRTAPIYILADLIEEDFQRVTMPHVRGRAGVACFFSHEERNAGTDGISERDVCNDSVAEKRVDAMSRAIDELIGDNEVQRTMLFLQ